MTGVLMPPLTRLLRGRSIMDVPGHRSSHDVPVPRGGGLSPVAAVILIAAINGLPWVGVGATVAFAAIGASDDLRDVSPRLRLALQFLIAVTAVLGLCLSGYALWPVVLVLGPLLVCYVNVFNFMDGVNGIAALQAIVVAVACLATGLVTGASDVALGSALIGGAAAAFLPFNFPRAQVFLGDVGSYGLGAALATLLAFTSAHLPVWATLLIPSVYLADVFWTLVRRAWSGCSMLEPHRDHVYQRLLQLLGTHARVSAFVTVASALVAASAVTAGLTAHTSTRVSALLLAAGVLIAYLCAPTLLARGFQPRTVAGQGPGEVQVAL